MKIKFFKSIFEIMHPLLPKKLILFANVIICLATMYVTGLINFCFEYFSSVYCPVAYFNLNAVNEDNKIWNIVNEDDKVWNIVNKQNWIVKITKEDN